jgi:hypothetical protein
MDARWYLTSRTRSARPRPTTITKLVANLPLHLVAELIGALSSPELQDLAILSETSIGPTGRATNESAATEQGFSFSLTPNSLPLKLQESCQEPHQSLGAQSGDPRRRGAARFGKRPRSISARRSLRRRESCPALVEMRCYCAHYTKLRLGPRPSRAPIQAARRRPGGQRLPTVVTAHGNSRSGQKSPVAAVAAPVPSGSQAFMFLPAAPPALFCFLFPNPRIPSLSLLSPTSLDTLLAGRLPRSIPQLACPLSISIASCVVHPSFRFSRPRRWKNTVICKTFCESAVPSFHHLAAWI